MTLQSVCPNCPLLSLCPTYTCRVCRKPLLQWWMDIGSNYSDRRTTEDCYSVTRTIDGLPYFLSLTDTAGQEEYRGLWAGANLKSDAFLLVYDITNETSLATLDFFLDMIDIETEERTENSARLRREIGGADYGTGEQIAVGTPPPVRIVAGNKCDLKEARVVTAQQGLEYARKRGCGFMETSAREMVNIEETFARRFCSIYIFFAVPFRWFSSDVSAQ